MHDCGCGVDCVMQLPELKINGEAHAVQTDELVHWLQFWEHVSHLFDWLLAKYPAGQTLKQYPLSSYNPVWQSEDLAEHPPWELAK